MPRSQRDEVLVPVMAAAVNPKDAFIRKGRYRLFTGNKFPLRLGHDFAGIVAEIGAAVRHLKIGDRVFGM
jgi:NADPH:quinone reductase-like Zn-dependent oxidoreductase